MEVHSKVLRGLGRATAGAAIVALAACSVSIDSDGESQSVALIDRLPASAQAVFWVDIEALAAATTEEEWNEYEEMLQDDDRAQDLERFTEATGIDPREDLEQVAMATLATATEPADVLLLMSADFDRDKLIELAADADSVDYEGTTFYLADDVFASLEQAVGRAPAEEEPSIDAPVADERPGYLAILDPRTLAMGSRETLAIAVDVGAGRADAVSSNAAMVELIDGVDDEGQIWMVATRDTWQNRLDDIGQGGAMVPTNAIESIEVVTMSMRMGDGMSLRISGFTATPEAAAELVNSLNGVLAMGRMMLQQSEPELYGIIDRAITVNQDGQSIRIEARLTEQDIDTLQRMAEEQMPR